MKNKAAMFVLFIVLLSCTKKNNINVALSGTLTNCPANSTCTYNYYNNADFVNANGPVQGNYRVFWYKSVNSNQCGFTSQLSFKTLPIESEFNITSNQIASGQIIAYNTSCPCCDYANLTKPIGGEIKGKMIDATHFLVNASIVFGVSQGTPVDTLVINQYFTLKPQ